MIHIAVLDVLIIVNHKVMKGYVIETLENVINVKKVFLVIFVIKTVLTDVMEIVIKQMVHVINVDNLIMAKIVQKNVVMVVF